MSAFSLFDKICEAVYWIMIFEYCDRDGRTLGKSDKGESHFFINIRIYSLECWNYVLTFGLLLWYWCAWIWHLVLKWPSDRKWNNIVVTSSWGLLFDLSLNWTTYPGTNGQKMDQAVMILMLLKRIRNFKLEPFTIPNCLPNSDVHHQLFPTYSLSQLTLRSGDCKSTKLTLFLFILKRKHFHFVTAWMSYLSDVSVANPFPIFFSSRQNKCWALPLFIYNILLAGCGSIFEHNLRKTLSLMFVKKHRP